MIFRAVLSTALLFNVLTRCLEAKRGFLFTVPGVLQQGTTEKGCVTFQDLSTVRIVVQLNKGNSTVLAESATLQDQGCLDLTIDGAVVEAGEYELEVTGHSDNYTYTDTGTVRVEASSPLVFIQTDKPIYKPGQTVKLRVLAVGADLKPRMDPISEIFIQDPNGVRMMQWLDEDVIGFQGIADVQMPLSTEPVQGSWKVSVRPGPDDAVVEESFKVEEYVLPKYEITIRPPSYFVINMKQVSGEVCAMYTYGEPVRGVLSMKVCYERSYYSWQTPDQGKPPCEEKEYTITGCEPFDFDVSSLNIDANRWGYNNGEIVLKAEVLENATGVSLNKTARVEVTRQLYQLDFNPYSSDTFKPGLPYYGKVKVTRPDGTPAPDEKVEITMNSNRREFRKTFVSDPTGEVIFTLPPLKDDDTSLSIHASMPDHLYDYTESHLQPYTPSSYHSIRQWYSPSKSFLLIDPIETVVGCRESVVLNVTHIAEAGPGITFFYQLMSSGNLLKAGSTRQLYSNSRKRVYLTDGTFKEDSLYDCPEGKEWNNCASSCVATCLHPEPICDRACMPRCECKHPKVLWHNGRCVEPSECPATPNQTGCSGGRVRNSCGSSCTPTCDNRQPLCTMQCVDRCQCPPENPLWGGQACITEEACPGYVPSPAPNQERSVVSLPLTVDISPNMSPEVKVIVYYVRDDGETVADSMSLKVEECSKNEVELKFNEETRYPGEDATMSLRAAPGSVCSVGAVDKSVSLLGGNKALTLSEVLSRLAQYQLTENSLPGKDTYCEDQVKAREEEDDKPPRRHHKGAPRPPGGPPRRRGKRSVLPWPGRYYSQYYDSMHAFKHSGVVAVGDVELEVRPCETFQPIVYYSPGRPAIKGDAGVFLQERRGAVDEDSPIIAESQPDAAVPAPKKKTLDVRTYFPETWLWDLHYVGDSGSLMLTEKLPHTVTEWIASGFCTHTQDGIGVSGATAIKGFQPFFLSLTLPVSVVRGEVLKLPVTVFNYLSDCLVVKVTLKASDQYYHVGLNQSSHCVCGRESATAYFNIGFTELGEIPIKVEAESVDNNGQCGNTLFMSDQLGVRDAVERPLLVEPEGREVEVTESAYLCPQGARVTQSVKLDLPEDYVEGTPRATFAVIGDIMGPTLSGLDRLVRLPMGCGEQNMILFAPNIYVMQYLTSTNQVTKEVKDKALGFMQTGYQRELTYRHDDGSYSAFGRRDESGSTWLTAYVLKSFAQAKNFIFIDVEDLKMSTAWLMSKQTERGCFLKVGTVHHKDMKGGVDGGVSLTTFVLVALLEAKPHVDIPNVDQAITEAFTCLEFESITDTYTLSLLAYAYALSGRQTPHRAQVIKVLTDRAIDEDGLVHWTRETQQEEPVDGWEVKPIHRPTSLDVEMTAYVLQALVATEANDTVIKGVPMVKWLSAQRNAYGGFSSTQDTVVALQALASYASLVYTGRSDLTVTATSTRGDYESFQVSDSNRLLLQRKDIQVPSSLTIDVVGSGCALVQSTLKYSVANISRGQPSFTLAVDVQRYDNCKMREMQICAKYEGTDGASNMAVVEVKMVSGWIPVKSSIKSLLKKASLNLKKHEIDMNKVHFYFDELTPAFKCFKFLIEQYLEVEDAKPGRVEVYDYYDDTQDMRVTEAYEIQPICGTKEELPVVSPEEYDEINNRDPLLIEQARQPLPGGPPSGTKEDLPEITPEEFEEMNRRNPEDIEQVRRPLPGGPPSGTKEDLPDITPEEFDRMNRRNPEDIEQVRRPVPDHPTGTKEDLPEITPEEFEEINRRNPEDIEQVRVPRPDPPRHETKEDLPDVTREEYDAMNRRPAEEIEQVRVPISEVDSEESEVVVPVDSEDLCPLCYDSAPPTFGSEVCNYGFGYKAVLVRHPKYKLKLLTEFYTAANPKLETEYHLPDNCECEALTYRRNGKLLILSPPGSGPQMEPSRNKASLTLGGGTKVYKVPTSGEPLRAVARNLKKALRACG